MYQRSIQSRKSSLEIRILNKKNFLDSIVNEWGLEVRFKFVFGQGHLTTVFCKIYV